MVFGGSLEELVEFINLKDEVGDEDFTETNIASIVLQLDKNYRGKRGEEAANGRQLRDYLLTQLGDEGMKLQVSRLLDIRHANSSQSKHLDQRLSKDGLYTKYFICQDSISTDLKDVLSVVANRYTRIQTRLDAVASLKDYVPKSRLERELIKDMAENIANLSRASEGDRIQALRTIGYEKLMPNHFAGKSVDQESEHITYMGGLPLQVESVEDVGETPIIEMQDGEEINDAQIYGEVVLDIAKEEFNGDNNPVKIFMAGEYGIPKSSLTLSKVVEFEKEEIIP